MTESKEQQESQVDQREEALNEATVEAEQGQSPENAAEAPGNEANGTEAGDDGQPEAPTAEALAEAQQKAEENYDLALRTTAEMENLKRRTQKDVENARKFALEKIANELLAVRDSMEMGLQAAQDDSADVAKLREGADLTLKMLVGVMEKFHIEPVDPQGEKFDPELHQAMSMVESEEQDPNTVIDVMQKGYTLNGRLLRPALVSVAKGK
ncbi:MAG: nucleotide exchange factor GrpE [Pseudomonadota bacterium]